jgi:hypothetical protein
VSWSSVSLTSQNAANDHTPTIFGL